MKIIETIFLKHDFAEAAARLKGRFADPSHVKPDQYVEKTCRLVAPGLGIVAMFLQDEIPQEACEEAFDVCWPHVRGLPSNRSVAVGTPSLSRIRKDRTLSDQKRVSKDSLAVLKKRGTRTDVLGFVGGTRWDRSRLSRRHPELLDKIRPLAERVDGRYSEYMPGPYAKQLAAIEEASPARRLWDTVFSAVYLAKIFQAAYHRDGNLKGVMTALMATGNFSGGQLVFPRWKIAIVLRPGDLLFFDAEQLHGNLEIKGDRLSFAFHCVSMRRLLK